MLPKHVGERQVTAAWDYSRTSAAGLPPVRVYAALGAVGVGCLLLAMPLRLDAPVVALLALEGFAHPRLEVLVPRARRLVGCHRETSWVVERVDPPSHADRDAVERFTPRSW